MNKTNILTFRSHPTKQDAICLALKYAHEFGMTNSDLSREYDLRRSTLSAIESGRRLIRNRDWFYDNIVMALNDMRLRAVAKGNHDLVNRITLALADLCLVYSNLATDSEIDTFRN